VQSGPEHGTRGAKGTDNMATDKSRLAQSETRAGAVAPGGWQLVPVEPTEEMTFAGGNNVGSGVRMEGPPQQAKRKASDIWNAMLAAAPQPPARRSRDDE
jgi:hypothetical protein